MKLPFDRPLWQDALLVGRGFRHDAYSSAPLLSIKSMFNGQAFYRAARAEFVVDDSGYLILNDQQPYEIHIDSPTRVESFVVLFPRNWAGDALRVMSSSAVRLLDEPNTWFRRATGCSPRNWRKKQF